MEDWREVSARKKKSNLEKIPNEWRLSADIRAKYSDSANVLDVPKTSGVLSSKEVEITEAYDASGLLERIAAGELSSYDVAVAFCKRAAIAHQLVNCLTEIFFDQALERAKELDEYYEKNKKTIGPLHGLPISLKDSFNIKGVQSTVAYVSFASHPPQESNSVLVDLLLSQGAVVYVKTNIPQTMMTADSDNPLFGRTLNPLNLSLTAGGSTGGEGALIALRGSLMGAGTDIAGSLRIPALCNGIYGFKPTSSRVPFSGKTPPGRLGSPSPIIASIGPEAHSIRDLELFMSTVIRAEPWDMDETCLTVPWRSVTIHGPLRIGLILEDPKRPLHPNMLRTMKTALTRLKSKGHSIIDITTLPTSLWTLSLNTWKFFRLDPQKTPLKHIAASSEPWVPSIAATMQPEFAHFSPDLDALFEMNVERKKVVKEFHDLMREYRLDTIMMPPYQTTAVPHDTYGFPVYTALANYLDWPAGVLPFGKAEMGREREEGFVREGVVYEPEYLPEKVEGMPTGLQFLARPMRDEELLKIMAIVEDDIRD
ncbi:amidase [Microthyrium microscopicum]|uniref:Amidase n=1 Tax=Microthyrium microscopicum TaxID=703497 RepID=A0A6A6UKB6_9PEZI|nr:amidase [Microthyrium microscopicum]